MLAALFVQPEEPTVLRLVLEVTVVGLLAHLRVELGVPEDGLFHVLLHLLIPFVALAPLVLEQPLFQSGQLVDLGGAQVDVLPTRIELLQGLEQAPTLTLHQVCGRNDHAAALAVDAVDEHSACDAARVLDEVLALRADLILGVQDGLLVAVVPLEGQLGHSDGLPVVGDVACRTVYDVGHFVGYYEI